MKQMAGDILRKKMEDFGITLSTNKTYKLLDFAKNLVRVEDFFNTFEVYMPSKFLNKYGTFFVDVLKEDLLNLLDKSASVQSITDHQQNTVSLSFLDDSNRTIVSYFLTKTSLIIQRMNQHLIPQICNLHDMQFKPNDFVKVVDELHHSEFIGKIVSYNEDTRTWSVINEKGIIMTITSSQMESAT